MALLTPPRSNSGRQIELWMQLVTNKLNRFEFGIVPLPIYANNTLALAGGLVSGDLYRTGGDPDTVCVVH